MLPGWIFSMLPGTRGYHLQRRHPACFRVPCQAAVVLRLMADRRASKMLPSFQGSDVCSATTRYSNSTEHGLPATCTRVASALTCGSSLCVELCVAEVHDGALCTISGHRIASQAALVGRKANRYKILPVP